MIVYRVEHRENPLRGGFRPIVTGVAWRHLPNPYNDRGLGRHFSDNEVCGATPDKFEHWWPADPQLVQRAHEEGYHAIALDVPQEAARVGEYQVLLDRTHPSVRIVGELRVDPVLGWSH